MFYEVVYGDVIRNEITKASDTYTRPRTVYLKVSNGVVPKARIAV